jgi:hypothetical protein
MQRCTIHPWFSGSCADGLSLGPAKALTGGKSKQKNGGKNILGAQTMKNTRWR